MSPDARPAATIHGAPELAIDALIRNLVTFTALIAFVPYFLGALSPRLAGYHLFAPIVLGCLWAFVISYAMFGRRPQHP